MTDAVLADPNLAGIHFTGSTAVFQMIWRQVGEQHRPLPDVSAAGGRDGRQGLHRRARQSADPLALATAIVRGGYEYQGQKCSAASRIYVPQSLWPTVREQTLGMMEKIRVGDVTRLPQLHGRGDRP